MTKTVNIKTKNMIKKSNYAIIKLVGSALFVPIKHQRRQAHIWSSTPLKEETQINQKIISCTISGRMLYECI